MAIDAKLTLQLERFVLGSGYWLHTNVILDPVRTSPVELYNSLLIRLSTTTQPDALARVCSRSDLAAYPELVPAPLTPYEFQLVRFNAPDIQAHLASISVGNHLNISPIPDIWEELGITDPFTATVLAKGGTGSDYVIIDSAFPTYASGLAYTITSGVTVIASGSDGVARRHNPNGWMYCRIDEDYTVFSDLSAAINKLEAVRSEAQGLVDDYDRSGNEFEGDTEETFT